MTSQDDERVSVNIDVIAHASTIVGAYLRNNHLAVSELPAMIRSVHTSLSGLSSGAESTAEATQKPAVPVKRSITADYIICLEDGKRLKMLKRYLRTRYGLSVEQYRAKWGLPRDYPMVAPNYAARRSALAKSSGLGIRKPPAKKRKRG